MLRMVLEWEMGLASMDIPAGPWRQGTELDPGWPEREGGRL